MTEPLDLDALVAWREHCGCHEDYVCVFHQLVAELRATRAERDALDAIVRMAGEWPKAMARAERAEAALARVTALVDDDVLCRTVVVAHDDDHCPARLVRAALDGTDD